MNNAFHKLLALVLLAVAPALSPLPIRAADIPKTAPNGKPWNVLMIAFDDLNDYPSILANYPGVKTPNLDAFASTSLLFSRACTPATSCMPARTAIMSGLAPWRSGVTKNGEHWDEAPGLKGIRSMPQLFRESGWHTMTQGKIYHEPQPVMKEGTAVMWDEPGEWGNYAPKPDPDPLENLGVKYNPAASFGLAPGESNIQDFQRVAVTEKILARTFEKPFYLAHGIFYPHSPHSVPQRFLDLYPEDSLTFPPPGFREGDLDDMPESGKKSAAGGSLPFGPMKEKGHWKPFLRHYLACVSAADELFGRVLAALDRSPHKDNTIVVVYADHGFHLGEKEHFTKFTVWERTARVLFMMRIPGVTPTGATCERVVSTQDIYPTLVELCGLQPPGHELSGRSLAPLLAQPTTEWPHPVVTYHSPSVQGIRNERFRYITYGGKEEELYDLDSDPHEWTNLAADPEYAPIKAELAAALKATIGAPVAVKHPKVESNKEDKE